VGEGPCERQLLRNVELGYQGPSALAMYILRFHCHSSCQHPKCPMFDAFFRLQCAERMLLVTFTGTYHNASFPISTDKPEANTPAHHCRHHLGNAWGEGRGGHGSCTKRPSASRKLSDQRWDPLRCMVKRLDPKCKHGADTAVATASPLF